MGYKFGVDKKQLILLPVSLEEYIPEDHICRVIVAFTDQVDIKGLGYKYAECKEKGCPPYDPRMMLNLFIYGYLHRVRSSRRLEAETKRNVEVMWLMGGLCPDDKTISNFRKDNTNALRETFRVFVTMCRKLGLYGEEETATDGTKVRANNSLKHHYNKTVVDNEIARIDQKINEYLSMLEQGDKEDAIEIVPSSGKIKEALQGLKERKIRYEELKKQVEKEGEQSTVDPDSRIMRSAGDGRTLDVGYNVQTVVDSKYHMIVDFEVTNSSSDTGNLHKMSERAKEIMEVEALTNLADKGYYDSKDIAACEASGITCLVAKRKAGGCVKTKEFSHERFVYNAEEDKYICPCGYQLRRMRTAIKNGGNEYQVYANYEACASCQRKTECTNYRYREMWRLPYQDIIDTVDERTRNNKEQYRKRQEIVEHVFGTIKAVWGYKQYLCRGKPKVTTETALAYLAYNMRRVVTIFKEAQIMPVFG